MSYEVKISCELHKWFTGMLKTLKPLLLLNAAKPCTEMWLLFMYVMELWFYN
jgi:hypothetical protein